MNPLIRWLFLVVLLLFPNIIYAASESFFPESTVNDMRENLDSFLMGVPQNNGQKKHIDRVLEYSEHERLMLFVDTDYSQQSIAKIAQLQDPFLLLETLDIVSVNLGRARVFSNFFIDKVVEYSQQKNIQYMTNFFKICKKSDGYYSEYLYGKLVNILEKNPGAFLEALAKSNAVTEICEILKFGDRARIINIVDSVDSTPEYSKIAGRLSMCLEGK